MKNKVQYLVAFLLFAVMGVAISSCEKDPVAVATKPQPQVQTASFVEQFNNAGDLGGKGWIFRNNSIPIGQNGWRQGRYESAAQQQYKFLGPVPFLGFPAYNASTSPNDFISCDATCVNDALTGTGNISTWLISPPLPMKNGDSIVFYTRAVDDANYGWFCKDRMQVRFNYSGTTDVGDSPFSTGAFSVLGKDINPGYIFNDPAGNASGAEGYPRTWTKMIVKLTGVPGGSVANGRFAFRYMGVDAGVFGGSSAENYPSVVGIDSLAFVHQ